MTKTAAKSTAAASRRWKEKNRERVAANVAAWHVANRDRRRYYRIEKAYGLTRDAYESMYKAQSGKCAICECQQPKSKLHIDHDHSSGSVRALLCFRCNAGIGLFWDKSELLAKASAYIERHTKP